MSAAPPLLIVLEEHFDRLRQHHAATHTAYQDIIMTLAERFANSVEKLIARLDGHDALLDAAKKAEAAAEAERDDLKARLTAAEDKAKADADAMAAKLADLQAKLEAELDPAPFQAVVDKIEARVASPDTTAPAEAAEPASSTEGTSTASAAEAAPVASPAVVSEAPSGAVVTVDSSVGATTHEAVDGTVTTVPHDGATPTAVNTVTGQAAEPAPDAVAEALNATADAGVTVPAAS